MLRRKRFSCRTFNVWMQIQLRNIWHLSFCHGNNGYANAHHCSRIRNMPDLSLTFRTRNCHTSLVSRNFRPSLAPTLVAFNSTHLPLAMIAPNKTLFLYLTPFRNVTTRYQQSFLTFSYLSLPTTQPNPATQHINAAPRVPTAWLVTPQFPSTYYR
jgi:hypothetical protein